LKDNLKKEGTIDAKEEKSATKEKQRHSEKKELDKITGEKKDLEKKIQEMEENQEANQEEEKGKETEKIINIPENPYGVLKKDVKQKVLSFTSKTVADNFYDQFSGYRLTKRLTPDATFKEAMKDKVVKKVQQVIEGPQLGKNLLQVSDWVLVGVLGTKSDPKKAKNETAYAVWHITDLKENFVKLTLFGEAFKALWKVTAGSVIAVVNPKISHFRDTSKDTLALQVTDPETVKIIGLSRDFAKCAWMVGKRNCHMVVHAKNKYCTNHFKEAMLSTVSIRMDMQSSNQIRLGDGKKAQPSLPSIMNHDLPKPKPKPKLKRSDQKQTSDSKDYLDTAKMFCEKNNLGTVRTGLKHVKVIRAVEVSAKKMDPMMIKKLGFNPSLNIVSKSFNKKLPDLDLFKKPTLGSGNQAVINLDDDLILPSKQTVKPKPESDKNKEKGKKKNLETDNSEDNDDNDNVDEMPKVKRTSRKRKSDSYWFDSSSDDNSDTIFPTQAKSRKIEDLSEDDDQSSEEDKSKNGKRGKSAAKDISDEGESPKQAIRKTINQKKQKLIESEDDDEDEKQKEKEKQPQNKITDNDNDNVDDEETQE